MLHTDGCSPVWEEGRRELPVAADALEMHPEGVYQVWRGRLVVDVVHCSQFLGVEVVCRLRWPGRSGGHDFPVPGRKGAVQGIVP